MTTIVEVDWLGRGGIAQCSESWAIELEAAGHEVHVVTRAGRELGAGAIATTGPTDHGGAIRSHLALCRFAAARIRALRPAVVVIQNYVIPALEEPVHRAARDVGATIVFVIHDHRHREWREGGHLGLRRQITRADHVVAHSTAVAEAEAVAGSAAGRTVEEIPLPVPLGLVAAEGEAVLHPVAGSLLAAQVGVLNRRYKGTDVVVSLAERGVPGWSFGFAGSGAPPCPAAQSVDRFLDAGELTATLRAADATVLPYRHATQSAVVVLSQLCGTVPVAAAVDGLAEQIEDGVTGLLMPPGASVEAWAERLGELSSPAVRERIATAGTAAVWAQHDRFRTGLLDLIERS